MASVHRRTTHSGTIVYRVMWREPGTGGKKHQRQKDFPTAKLAKAFAADVLQSREHRGIGDPGKHTVASFMKHWISNHAARGEVSPATISSYIEQSETACRHIGHVALEKLSSRDLDILYVTLLRKGGVTRKRKDGTRGTRPLKPSSVRATHRVLHAAFEQARKWKLISENPGRDAKPPAARKSPVKDFTVEQVGRLLAAAARDSETYCITALFLTCGIRRSELLGLALDAVDFEVGKIRIKRVVIEVRGSIDPDTGEVTKKRQKIVREVMKTDASARVITLPAPMLDLLRQQRARVLAMALKWGKGYQRDPMFLFPDVAGEAGQPQNLLYRMRAVMRRANVVGRSPCHAWRHTSATQLLDSGQNIKTVQRRLGHASLTSTAIYLHPVDERDAEAAADLGALLTGSGEA